MATLYGRERDAADALTSLQDFGSRIRTPSILRAIEAYQGELTSYHAFFPPPNGYDHGRGVEYIGPDAAPYFGSDPISYMSTNAPPDFDGYAPIDSGVVTGSHHYSPQGHPQHYHTQQHPMVPFHMQQPALGHIQQHHPAPLHMQQPALAHILQHHPAPLHMQQPGHMQHPAPGHMQQPGHMKQHRTAPTHGQQPAPGHMQQQSGHMQRRASPMRFCSNCRRKAVKCGGLCACQKDCHGPGGCTRHRQANHSTKAGSTLCKDCRVRHDLPCRPCGSYIKRQGPGCELVLKRKKKQGCLCGHGPIAKRRKIDDESVTSDDIRDGLLPMHCTLPVSDFGDASGAPANTSASGDDHDFHTEMEMHSQDDSTTNAVENHNTSLPGDVAGEGSISGYYLCYKIKTPEELLPDEDLFRGLKDRVGQILQLQDPGREGHPWDHQLCYWPYLTNKIMDNVFIYQLFQGKLNEDSIHEALRLLKMAIRRLNAIDLVLGYDLIVNPVDLRAYLIRCARILEDDARKQGLIQ